MLGAPDATIEPFEVLYVNESPRHEHRAWLGEEEARGGWWGMSTIKSMNGERLIAL